uniref:Elongation of very long chain fatty acids protein n=1 Tax=Ditylenchus dipsaci TaxID=166011 RepID=A0A915CL15_9BILA
MSIFFSEYNYERTKQWLSDHEGFQIKASIAYILTIWVIKYVMANRKPFEFTYPLIYWNAFVAVFSIAGFVRMTPTVFRAIQTKGLTHTYTQIGELQTDKVAGYWAFLWVVSKVPEFVDTIFIVLRKKPLMFMHWYHHALTGYFAYVTFAQGNAYAMWVVYMNYFIHSFMYTYFCIRALTPVFRFRVHPQFAQWMTGAQIVQFLITHVVMGHLLYLCATTNKTYAVTVKGFAVGTIMEVSYLLLWFHFYYVSYIGGGGKKYLAHVNISPEHLQSDEKKVE